MKPVPLVLVTGFLGAGKTTLMRHLIAEGHARGLKLCVIVNEFGASDVDGHILQTADAELLQSITGGCACCAGQDDFLQTLQEVAMRDAEQRPDIVLIEASGLADPVTLLDVMTAPELLPALRTASVLCVTDATRATEYGGQNALWPLLNHQLRLADIILINKVDLETPSTLQTLSAQFQALSPHARVLPTRQCEIAWQELGARVETTTLRPSTPSDSRAAHTHAHTAFIPMPHPVERANLEATLAKLPPEVWRAKGFVRVRGESDLFLVQLTGGGRSAPRFRLAPFYLPFGSDEPITGIVLIGSTLNEEALLRAFGSATRY